MQRCALLLGEMYSTEEYMCFRSKLFLIFVMTPTEANLTICRTCSKWWVVVAGRGGLTWKQRLCWTKFIFEISDTFSLVAEDHYTGWERSREFAQKKSEITAQRGLDSRPYEGREYIEENGSLHILNRANFPAYAGILLFYFGGLFVTSDGWGISSLYAAAKFEEHSDYFSWPYMNLLEFTSGLVFFSPSCAFSWCFLSDGVPGQLHPGSYQRYME